ncbi:GNAT family N-acetyltransferase [Macrococcus armenti]|uniref:GNAT family N-acetyltransferase n=1 Tax=Macrococcus armenti TaxID=2875764 RepID=UPI001CD64359|nr:GNAT family N-acetyltransferase [Macrococcus armenti]UBH11403.1 GNAT family N-acetyltransferase [Macrococcus armenti]
MSFFETERLIFRNWCQSDLPYYIELNRNEEVRKYFPDVLSKERSELIFDMMQNEIESTKLGLFAVTLKDGSFIGFIGSLLMQEDTFIPYSPFYEIGWRLLPEYWGKGYATEGAQGLLKYMQKLNISYAYAYTSVHNHESLNVIKKLNMEKLTTFHHPVYRNGEQVMFRRALHDTY